MGYVIGARSDLRPDFTGKNIIMVYRRVIYVSNSQLTVYRVGKSGIRKDLTVNNLETGNDVFLGYLHTIEKRPIPVLVDILEEEFHLEYLPHLGQKDRKALIQRKQKQVVHGAHFTHHKSLCREKTGRRDDRVLFMAIRNEAILSPWLKSLHLAKIPIVGVFSVPLMYEKLLKIFPTTEDMFLVTVMPSIQQSKFLVRQTYFNHQQLVLSRLNQVSVQSPDNFAQEMADEIDRMRRYIVRAYKLSSDQIIKTHIITPEELIRPLQGQQSALDKFNQGGHSEFHSVPSIGSKLGLSLPSDTQISMLVSFWLSQKRLFLSHYKDTTTIFYFYHHIIKQLMYGVSTLLVLGGISYASACLINAKNIGVQAEQHKYKIRQSEQSLGQTPRVDPIKGYTAFQIEDMVTTAEKVNENIVIPTTLLGPVSQVLSRYPTLMINGIEWGDGGTPETNASQAFSDSSEIIVELDPGTGENLKRKAIKTRLRAEIEPFDGDFRQAHLLINRFVVALGLESAIQSAKVTQFPINLSHKATISGEMGNRSNASLKANFTIELEIYPK